MAETDMIKFWEARLEECIGGANVAKRALASLGVFYPVHLVEPEVPNIHQLKIEQHDSENEL